MTPVQLGYMIRGLAADATLPADKLALVVRAAVLESTPHGEPARAAPPMRAIAVGQFCVHNIHIAEVCSSCRGAGGRIMPVNLPLGAKQVYIAVAGGADAGHGNEDSRGEDATAPSEAGSAGRQARGE